MEPVFILLIALAVLALTLVGIVIWWTNSIDVPMSASSTDWTDDDYQTAAIVTCIVAAT